MKKAEIKNKNKLPQTITRLRQQFDFFQLS